MGGWPAGRLSSLFNMAPARARVLLACLALQLSSCAYASSIDCYGAMVEVQVNSSSLSAPMYVYGYPASFGAALNATLSAPAPLAWVSPENACSTVAPAAVPGSVGLVARGNCSFSDKARSLQQAGYEAMMLVDSSDDCTFMFANRSAAAGISIAAVSVTSDAGVVLQQLLAGGTAMVSMREPPESRVDWSSAVLWLLATGTVLGAAVWAGHDLLDAQYGGAASRKGIEQGQHEEALHITSGGAVWFVVLSSAMLLLLFFFLSKWLALLLVILFAVGAWQATASVMLSALAAVCPPAWHAIYCSPLPVVGALPALSLAASAVSGAVALTWVLCRHAHWAWVLQDVLAVCLMLVILRQLQLPNLKVASILLPLAFFYDVFFVFIQPALFGGQSVMVEVATGGESHEQLPMVLKVPHWPSLGSNPAFSLLGFGDVVLPGLLAVFTRRFDVSGSLSWAAGYCAPCIAGYAAGLGVTYLALVFRWFGDQGQPALLYLVPCTLGTVAALAWRRGQLRALWHADLSVNDSAAAAAAAASSLEAGADEQRSLLHS